MENMAIATKKGISLKELALAANSIRQSIIRMLAQAGSGHPGGSLSIADIMAVLFWDEMNFSLELADSMERDRFILSKGHGAPALYAGLHLLGFLADEDLALLRTVDGRLEGHPHINIPGVEMSTGSLGQGLSVSIGLALAARLYAQKTDQSPWRVYTILGDGEAQEGMIWEAAMSAPHYKLDNLVAFLDLNNLQIDGEVSSIKPIEPVAEKFQAFGWNVIPNVYGHDIEALRRALDEARSVQGKPTIIIAQTVKGKGVSYMENKVNWHGVAPSPEEAEIALTELGEIRQKLLDSVE